MDKPSDILNRAAEIMIERGHAKKNFVTDDGRICVLGACRYAAVGSFSAVSNPQCVEVDDAVSPFLSAVTGYDFVPSWNDREETTETMAIGALHEAAILAKEAGE